MKKEKATRGRPKGEEKAQITFYLPPELAQAAREKAKESGMTLSTYFERMVKKEIQYTDLLE